MELNPETIEGDWAEFDGEYYFVYTKGNMLGFCVIGAHEPCFSLSTFFSKDDDTYKSQYEKFSSLLSGLKEKIEETEKNIKGGEQPMDEFEKKEEEVVNPAEEPEKEEEQPSEFEAEETDKEEEKEEETPAEEEETPAEPSEFEKLQASFEELQNSFNELQTKFNEAEATITSLNQAAEALREENGKLQATVANYEAVEAQHEVDKKNELIENYEKYLNEEEITPIKNGLNDFSYDELEGKLAIIFANKQMTGREETKKVPLPEPEKSSFALLMEKYRK